MPKTKETVAQRKRRLELAKEKRNSEASLEKQARLEKDRIRKRKSRMTSKSNNATSNLNNLYNASDLIQINQQNLTSYSQPSENLEIVFEQRPLYLSQQISKTSDQNRLSRLEYYRDYQRKRLLNESDNERQSRLQACLKNRRQKLLNESQVAR